MIVAYLPGQSLNTSIRTWDKVTCGVFDSDVCPMFRPPPPPLALATKPFSVLSPIALLRAQTLHALARPRPANIAWLSCLSISHGTDFLPVPPRDLVEPTLCTKTPSGNVLHSCPPGGSLQENSTPRSFPSETTLCSQPPQHPVSSWVGNARTMGKTPQGG